MNRLWQHAFGEGLVRTVDNFGRLGELPTHPELLDYLAARFVRDEGWSMKRMLRLLLTSETWQQSSRGEAAGLERDGANRWLSRMSLRRLEAEAIRDAILAVSGQLDLKMYGPGVSVYFVSRTEGGGASGPLDGDRRRSVYQRIRRNAFNPFLEAFDAPRPATTRGRRDVTNVPLQALTMLNDPFVIDQAAKWGALVVAEGASTEQRIGDMFLRAFGREISAGELRAGAGVSGGSVCGAWCTDRGRESECGGLAGFRPVRVLSERVFVCPLAEHGTCRRSAVVRCWGEIPPVLG